MKKTRKKSMKILRNIFYEVKEMQDIMIEFYLN